MVHGVEYFLQDFFRQLLQDIRNVVRFQALGGAIVQDRVVEVTRSDRGVVALHRVVQDLRIAPHGAPLAPAVSMDDMEKIAAENRAKLEDMASNLPGDIAIDVHISEGIAKGIVEYGNAKDVDMIAISTHGRTGFRHLVLGSVAEAVLRHAHKPVLCFPRVK